MFATGVLFLAPKQSHGYTPLDVGMTVDRGSNGFAYPLGCKTGTGCQAHAVHDMSGHLQCTILFQYSTRLDM